MTTPAVTFNYTNFITQFPIFSAVSAGEMQGYFAIATALIANSTCNQTAVGGGDVGIFTTAMYLATAHVAWLFAARDLNGNPSSTGTQPAPSIVGRISSAGEGSVNVSTEWGGSPDSPSAQFWRQTQYGAMLWQMMSAAMSGFYVPSPLYNPAALPFRGYFTGRRR